MQTYTKKALDRRCKELTITCQEVAVLSNACKAVNPINVMGSTKFIAEKIVFNNNYTSVRFGNVAGSRGSVIPVLIEEMLSKKNLTITDPNVTRFIMRISDAVKLVLYATKYAEGSDIFILKMKAFKLSDLIDILINHIAPKFHLENVKLNVVGLVPGEKLHEELINKHELQYLHDLGEFYVVRPKKVVTSPPSHIISSSSQAELISKNELLEIVNEYVNSYFLKYN